MKSVHKSSKWLIVLVAVVTSYNVLATSTISSNNEEVVQTTHYFEFYNNFWVNLHFYIYETASEVQKKKTLEDLIDIDTWGNLDTGEKEIFQNTVNYYREHIDLKNQFTNEYIGFRKWIINYSEKETLPQDSFAVDWIHQLNLFKEIYAKHFWEKHRAINASRLENNIVLIRNTEKKVLSKMGELARTEWQPNKIRVDLSIKSPGGGAFTLGRVPSSIVLGTVVNYKEIQGDWVETLFHEACHTIIKARKGVISESVNRISDKMKIKPLQGLWHAILFYMVGEVCKEAFFDQGITDYTLYMDRENVFWLYRDALHKYFKKYVEGEVLLDDAMKETIIFSANKLSLAKSVNAFNTAFQTGDITTLKNMLTDDYIHTNGGSKAINRKNWLAYMSKRKKQLETGSLLMHRYEMKEREIKLYQDDFAIVTGKVITEFTKDGQKKENQYRVTHVWIKEEGVWKRAAFHDYKLNTK